jgi:hypothetical protein
MFRKAALTALAATALIAAALPASAQTSSRKMMCIDTSGVSWNARMTLEQRDRAGNWSQLMTLVTVPSRRCEFSAANATHIRFTVEHHVDGGFRMACRLEAPTSMNHTMRVTGQPVGPACVIFSTN